MVFDASKLYCSTATNLEAKKVHVRELLELHSFPDGDVFALCSRGLIREIADGNSCRRLMSSK